jgi:hypothetical protein
MRYSILIFGEAAGSIAFKKIEEGNICLPKV